MDDGVYRDAVAVAAEHGVSVSAWISRCTRLETMRDALMRHQQWCAAEDLTGLAYEQQRAPGGRCSCRADALIPLINAVLMSELVSVTLSGPPPWPAKSAVKRATVSAQRPSVAKITRRASGRVMTTV